MTERGYPPSVREIGDAVGLSSPSTVHSHLSALVEVGALKRDPTKPRAIVVVDDQASAVKRASDRIRDVPVLGRIAAGTPILAAEHIEEVLPLPVDLVGNDPVFLLEVKGDSMIDAMVSDGDIVVMTRADEWRNGDMVAVWLRDREETTLKHIYREGSRVRLQPANPTMQPIYIDNPESLEVQGKVMLVVRQLN